MTEEEEKKRNQEDEDRIDPDEFEDDEGGSEDEGKAEDAPKEEPKKEEKPKEQTREERAKQAQARREREAREKERAEREEAIRKEAYLKGKLDSVKVNTFTNEPIEDEYDLEVYELQKKLESEGKDPLADLPKALAKMEREAKSKAEAEEKGKKEKAEAIDKDIADFRHRHPDVDASSLLNDPDFIEYSSGRLGKDPLSEIYESFDRLKSKLVGQKAEGEDGKRTPPPSPNGGRKTEKKSYSDLSEKDKIEALRKAGLIN